MALCFGIKRKIILITHQNLSCCLAMLALSKDLFCFLYCPDREEAVGAQGAGMGYSRTADWNWPMGYSILYGIMLNNETGRVGWERSDIPWGLSGNQFTGDEKFYPFPFPILIFLFFLSYFYLKWEFLTLF